MSFLGFFFDAWLALFVWFFCSLICFPFERMVPSVNRLLVPILYLIVLVFDIGFVEYYLTMNQPIDESIYYFSMTELQRIVGLESRINAWVILSFLLLIIVFFGVHRLLQKRQFPTNQRWRTLSLVVVTIAVLGAPFAKYTDTEDAANQAAVNNKIIYFVDESLRYFFQDDPLHSAVNVHQFQDLDNDFKGGYKEIDKQYPTFHALPSKSNLAPYFSNKSTQPPHVVVVVVESLSSDLVGVRAKKTGHLMPFLDSLSKQALYFPNCLSTAQRTHNVLPAVMCSVPNVMDGSVFQQINYPDHWSLFSLVKPYYRSRFYCGVFLEYINMRGFMNYQKADVISDHWLPEIQQHSDKVGSPWGYPDEDLFLQAAADDTLVSANGKQRLDVFLTISTHDPFVYPNKEQFTRLARSKFRKLKNSVIKRDLLKKADKLGAYCYTDQVLRTFFNRERAKQDFQNTIYIITGDHGTEQCYYDPISKYKVPLIIYSPLLRKTQQVDNVVTHLDITPSMLNLLRLNYQLNLPDKVPFIGKELDMRPGFHSDRSLVFTSSQLRTEECFFQHRFYVDGKTYRVNDRLQPIELKDKVFERNAKAQLKAYLLFSQYTINQNQLVPKAMQALVMGVKQWKVISNKSTAIRKLNWDQKMVPIVTVDPLQQVVKTVRIQVKLLVHCKRKQAVEALPDIAIATDRINWLVPQKTVYKGIRPQLIGKFKPKAINEVVYTLEFNPKDIDKLQSNPKLHLYFYHPKKVKLPISQIETVISTSK
jgi:uncharacterized sulfatase